MNDPSIELKLSVYSTPKMRHAIHAFKRKSAVAAATVFRRSETIEARRNAAQQLLTNVDRLCSDGLREGRQVGFPGVLGQGFRPVAAEHQALRSEGRHGVAHEWPRLTEAHQS